MSRSYWGALLLVLGLVMLWLFGFVVDLPGGLDFVASFVLGIVPVVVGVAMLWADYRSSSRRRDPEAERLAGIKDQIVWRAMAQGGRITAADAAAHAGLTELEAEHGLMSLVSDGQAIVEPGESGNIVYRIESPLAGAGES